jgi:hypothetical protein
MAVHGFGDGAELMPQDAPEIAVHTESAWVWWRTSAEGCVDG